MPRTRESTTSSSDPAAPDLARIERVMSATVSRDLVALLRRRGWTLRRMSTASGAAEGFVKRVEAGQLRFSARHIRGLARAARIDPIRLAFDAMEPSAM